MPKRSALILLFALMTLKVAAQNVDFFKLYQYQASRIYYAWSFTKTNDGGFAIVGEVNTPVNNDNIYLVKTNAAGDTLWKRQIGADTFHEAGHSIVQLSNGNLLIAGQITAQHTSASQGLAVCTDSLGNVLWQKVYDLGGYGYLWDIKVLKGNGYAFCGAGMNAGRLSGVLLKTDNNGNRLWMSMLGVNPQDAANRMVVTPDNGFLLAGYSFINRPGDFYSDTWLAKTDSLGQLQWLKNTIIAGVPESYERIVPCTFNGMITAYMLLGRLGDEMTLTKINLAGNTLWEKRYPASGVPYSYILPGDIAPMASAHFYIAAANRLNYTNMQLYLLKVDTAGNTIHQYRYSHPGLFWPRGLYLGNNDEAYIMGNKISPETVWESFLARITNINGSTAVTGPIQQQATITIFPNPATGGCTISSTDKPMSSIVIRDITGRILSHLICNKTYHEKLLLAGIAPGTVFISVHTGAPEPVVLKLVIQ